MNNTPIEWTEMTSNVIQWRDRRTGRVGDWFCVKCSPGCDHCYSERLSLSGRFPRALGVPFEREHLEHVEPILNERELVEIARRKEPAEIFVQEMGDLFLPAISDAMLNRVFTLLEHNPQHTFQLLTKRAARMRGYVTSRYRSSILPENIWWGVSAENQYWLERRLKQLLALPESAAVRYVSLEPLLGPINRYPHILLDESGSQPDVDWVIVGSESAEGGRSGRPCDLAHIRAIVADCQASGVPVFVKQIDRDGRVERRIEQFPADLRVREKPERVSVVQPLLWPTADG